MCETRGGQPPTRFGRRAKRARLGGLALEAPTNTDGQASSRVLERKRQGSTAVLIAGRAVADSALTRGFDPLGVQRGEALIDHDRIEVRSGRPDDRSSLGADLRLAWRGVEDWYQLVPRLEGRESVALLVAGFLRAA